MSKEHKYIVTLRDKKDAEDVINQMTSSNTSHAHIPSRSVTVVNELPHSQRNTHYALTHDEAARLRNDPRVLAVERPYRDRGIKLVHFSTYPNQIFDRNNACGSTMRNWGQWRHTKSYPDLTSRITANYDFVSNGAGVDIVVIDSGIIPGHPEWSSTYDGKGPSRLQQIDWYAVTGIEGSQEPVGGYYYDVLGHGSNCASLAAGSQHGLAKAANIYSIRIFSDDTHGAIPIEICFDMVRVFHENKPIVNGFKRPTICTNSWGFTIPYPIWQGVGPDGNWITTDFYSVYRRSRRKNITGPSRVLGQIGGEHGVRIASIDASIQDCIDAGVICIAAAGNNIHKIDVPGGLDWDNYWLYKPGIDGNPPASPGDEDVTEKIFYHRGGTPGNRENGSIVVGAVQVVSNYPNPGDPTVEQKCIFSCSGPGIDVYAHGYNSMGAYVNEPFIVAACKDSRDPNFYLNKLAGTSMACPQVAGICALRAQTHPNITAAEMREWLINVSDKNTIRDNTQPGAPAVAYWEDFFYLQGGESRVATWPYASNSPFTSTGVVTVSGFEVNLKK